VFVIFFEESVAVFFTDEHAFILKVEIISPKPCFRQALQYECRGIQGFSHNAVNLVELDAVTKQKTTTQNFTHFDQIVTSCITRFNIQKLLCSTQTVRLRVSYFSHNEQWLLASKALTPFQACLQNCKKRQ
jgi:hypothetical protein